MEWVAYQACFEDRLPGNPVVNDEESIDKCVEELSSAIQEALATSAPKRLLVPTHGPFYLPELGTKYALKSTKEAVASHMGPHSESSEVGYPSAERMENLTMEQRAGILGQREPVAVEADEVGDVCPNSFASLACA
jgi:hypothetical protein